MMQTIRLPYLPFLMLFAFAACSASFAGNAQAQNSTSVSPPNTLGGTPFPPPTSAQEYGTGTRDKNPRTVMPLYGTPTIGSANPVYENPAPATAVTNPNGSGIGAVGGNIGTVGGVANAPADANANAAPGTIVNGNGNPQPAP